MTNESEYYRKCSGWGRGMNEGYLADDQYFCSDKCLHTVYAPEQWTGLYDGGQNDDFYWTEWEEKSDEDDDVYDAAGNVVKEAV